MSRLQECKGSADTGQAFALAKDAFLSSLAVYFLALGQRSLFMLQKY